MMTAREQEVRLADGRVLRVPDTRPPMATQSWCATTHRRHGACTMAG
jgi:hypothetical protein